MKKLIFVLLIVSIVSKTLRLLTDGEGLNNLTVSSEEKKHVSILTIAQNIKNVTNGFCDTFNKLASTFKISKSETVKQFINREGFSQLRLTSRLFYNKNLMSSVYKQYMEARGSKLGIKEEDKDDYLTTVEFIPFEEKGGMFNAELFYKDGREDNSYSSFNVMASLGTMDDRYDITIHHFRIFDFKLADDILWTEKSTNYFNAFSNTKQEFKKVPKSLSKTEVQSLIDFYKLLTLKFIGETFGIDLQLPNLN